MVILLFKCLEIFQVSLDGLSDGDSVIMDNVVLIDVSPAVIHVDAVIALLVRFLQRGGYTEHSRACAHALTRGFLDAPHCIQ